MLKTMVTHSQLTGGSCDHLLHTFATLVKIHWTHNFVGIYTNLVITLLYTYVYSYINIIMLDKHFTMLTVYAGNLRTFCGAIRFQ